MTKEHFAALVHRLEDFSRKEPEKYKLRVALLAALGYVYVFGVLVLVLGLLGGLIAVLVLSPKAVVIKLAIKFGWVLGLLAFVIVRALWVRLDAPEGLQLKRGEVPALFELIDELRAALKAPHFHVVLLTSDFNASVVQVPRLGVFGWHRNFLTLGLPLLQALSPEQFRAVVAHEFAHLSGNHSRFAAWIYRVRQTWSRILEQIEANQQWGSVLFTRFIKWYSPFFNAWSFVLARADEYEADRCAVKFAGVQAASEALVLVNLKARLLNDAFWPTIYEQTKHLPAPPPATFAKMFHSLRAELDTAQAAKWLHQAALESTNLADTHPCLSDRLAAIAGKPVGETSPASRTRPALPAPPNRTAAQHFLGQAEASLGTTLEEQWRAGIEPVWKYQFEQAQEEQQKLAALEAKSVKEKLTEDEAWDRARWTAEFRTSAAAIALLREILIAKPQHAAANFLIGKLLLKEHDIAGVAFIEKAMGMDADAVPHGCELIHDYYKEQNNLSEAQRYADRAEAHMEKAELARIERSDVNAGDPLVPHGLSPAAIAWFTEKLAAFDGIKTAWLARKVVQHFPEKPFFVLCIKPVAPWWKPRAEDADQKLLEEVVGQMEFPAETFVVVINEHTAKLGKVVSKLENAEVFRHA